MEEGFNDEVANIEALGQANSGMHHRLTNLSREIEEAGLNEDELERRFEYYNAGEQDNLISTEAIPAQGLQPSLTDPKMWMVKTKPGKEKEAIVHLMSRYFLKQEMGESLNIFSAIAPEHTKGFIFVEADKEPNVRAAIHGIPNVFSFQTTLVPIAQMTSVLRVANEAANVSIGSWVRVKRGKYLGDLGRVHDIDASGQKLEIVMVPRLESSNAEEALEIADGGSGKGKRKKQVAATRPKQRPFNPDDYPGQLWRPETIGSKNFFTYNGERFSEDGYLYKWINVKSLETKNVTPTLDELQMFQIGMADSGEVGSTQEERLLKLAQMAMPAAVNVLFTKGDSVKVVTGSEKGLVGTVKAATPTVVTVILQSGGTSLVEQFEPKSLVKHFEVGDHVKVMAGKFKEETGLISNIQGDLVWVVNDSTLNTFNVLRNDIQKSVSVAKGQLKLGNYSLHDMVRLTDSNVVGVIVKIERDTFRILDQNGVVHMVEQPNMGAKVHSRDPVSFDKSHQQVTEGDLLKVVEGPFRGRQGKIIHLYRFYAFLECREILANGGIINVKTDHCMLLGGAMRKKRENPYALANPLMSPGNFKQMGAEAVTKVYARGKKKDSVVGKMGTITKGNFKAYRCFVRDASEDKLRVELQANRRLVTIPRDHFLPADGAAMTGGGDTFRSTNLVADTAGGWGWQTPSHTGMHTPARPSTPGVTATPQHGDNDDIWNPMTATPMHTGSSWGVGDEQVEPTTGGGGSSTGGEWTPSSTGEFGGYGPSSYSYGSAMSGYDSKTPNVAYTPGGGNTPRTTSYGQSPFVSGSGYDVVSPSPRFSGSGTPANYMGTPNYPMGTPGTYGGAGTPASYGTPGYTPATPNHGMGGASGGGGADQFALPANWHVPNILVGIVSTSEQGVILSVGQGFCTVSVVGSREPRDIAKNDLTPIKPELGDAVVVLTGPYHGNTAELTAIDRNDEALIKLSGSMTLVPVAYLAKLVRN